MGKVVGGLLGGGQKQTVPASGFFGAPLFVQRGSKEAINAARGFLEDPSIFEPAGITAPQQQALDVLSLGAQPLTGERFQEQLDVFQNPFTQQVIDPAIADLQRSTRGVLGDIGSQTSAAGGFGGTRQAILESEALRNLAQESGRLSAGLRSQGFESAAERALSQLGRQQLGASTLFDAGEALRQLQQQEQQAPVTAAQFLSSIVGSPQQYTGEPERTVSSGGGGLGGFGRFLSGAAQIGGIFTGEPGV